MIHIEGMGVTGCLLAWHLHHRGETFTWSENNAPINAWRASTGAIYPARALDTECLEVWRGWLREGFLPPDCFEEAAYIFNHKRPPHNGRYQFLREHGLGIAVPLSIHVNAQRLVKGTRAYFNVSERAGPEPKDLRIVAHGFGDRLHHVYWGWMRLVELRHPFAFDEGKGMPQRPAFYFREGRFVMAYAYPCPGTPYWYAGSSIIRQTTPRRLLIGPKYDRWKAKFEELSGGIVIVVSAHDYYEGWRPAPASDEEPWATREGDTVTVKPCWNDGIRHFPKVFDGVLECIGCKQ